MVNNLSFHGWLSVKQASNFQSLDNPRKVEKNMPRRPQSSTIINNNVGMMHVMGGAAEQQVTHTMRLTVLKKKPLMHGKQVHCCTPQGAVMCNLLLLLHKSCFITTSCHDVVCVVCDHDHHRPANQLCVSVAVAARQTTFFFSSTILTRLRCCNKEWRWRPASLNSSSLA